MACGVLFINPLPLDELSIIYPENYYSFTSRSKSLAFRIKDFADGFFYKKILKKIKSDKINILDIGGGTGTSLDLLRKADERVTATMVVDLDEHARDIAEAKGHQYFCGRIEEYQPVEKFDLILMLNLVEHVADPAEVLKKVKTLLNPSGLIIIKTPNHDSWDARLFRHQNWAGYHCPRHWVIFDKKSFIGLASGCSLTVVESSYTQGGSFWAQSMLHLMHKRKWISAGKNKPLVNHFLFGPISMLMAIFDTCRKPFANLSQLFFILRNDNNQTSNSSTVESNS